jgi:hypothetical protein
MIRIEEVRNIDPTILQPYARFEWETAGEFGQQMALRSSERIWLLEDEEPIVYAGVVRPSLLALPTLWFMLCGGFKRKHLRGLRRVMETLLSQYPRVQAYVSIKFPQAGRFAEWLGWTPLPVTFTISGIPHQLYEARR